LQKLNFNKDKFKAACQKYNLSLVILHGSYAKGTTSSKSDVDIGFLGELKDKYIAILRDFSEFFGDGFDPVFLNGAEAMITYQVALTGIPLYEKNPGLFIKFKLAAISRYMDTKKFRELEKQYIKSVIKEEDD
jgi:predicted nucleotidyltransferase